MTGPAATAAETDPTFPSTATGPADDRTGGGRREARRQAGIVAAVAVGAGLAIGPLAGVVVALVAEAMVWGPPWLRRVARLGPVLAYGVAAAYVLIRQVVSQPTSAFEWPAEQATAHQPALVAVALLVAVVALGAGDAPGGDGRTEDAAPDPAP